MTSQDERRAGWVKAVEASLEADNERKRRTKNFTGVKREKERTLAEMFHEMNATEWATFLIPPPLTSAICLAAVPELKRGRTSIFIWATILASGFSIGRAFTWCSDRLDARDAAERAAQS